MKRLIFLVAAAALVCACKPHEQLPPNGKAVYGALNCRVCHRIGSEGGLMGPDLTYVGFRKSKAWLDVWLKDPAAWRPGTQMPNPHLSDPARQVLVDYLSSLQGQDFDGHKPWDDPQYANNHVERGHVIFAKAGCITCHGAGGAGGYPDNNVAGGMIPALAHVSETYTKAELLAKITNGSKPAKVDPNGPDPLLFMPAWGRTLSKDEISDVADYVLSLGGKGGGNGEGF